MADAKFANEILDRQPQGTQESYPANVGKLYFWTLVTGAEEPAEVTHTWYFNDEKAGEVPLSIKYPRMRTWSSKTIPEKTGTWRVEVKDSSGNVLKEASVSITEAVKEMPGESASGETPSEQTPSSQQ